MAYRSQVESGRDIRTVTAQMMSDAHNSSDPVSGPASGLALLFEPHARPTADDVAALIARSAAVSRVLSISHRPTAEEGWLEVLCRGLTFDVTGLAPGREEPVPTIAHRFGFETDFVVPPVEAVTVCVGQHLAGGGNLLPVVRAHVEVARALMALPGVWAAVWCPADIAMSPQHFERVVSTWLDGGAFPVLGLTTVVREEDGGMRSHGLSFFTGQEVRIEPISGRNPAQLGKIIIRLIHRLVEGGGQDIPSEITGPEGQLLLVEPTDNGHVLRVWGKV